MIALTKKDITQEDVKQTNIDENVMDQNKCQDEEDVLESSIKSFELSSDDGLDQFKLRISDDEHTDKDGDFEPREESSGMDIVDKDNTQVDMAPSNEESMRVDGSLDSSKKCIDEKVESNPDDKSDIDKVENGICEEKDECLKELNENVQGVADLETNLEDKNASKEGKSEINESMEVDRTSLESEEKKHEDEPNQEEKEAEDTNEENCNGYSANADETNDSPISPEKTSDPASVSVRSVSMDSEVANPSEISAPEESTEVPDQMDDESQQSSNSTVLAEFTEASSKSRKRPRPIENDETTTSGAKRVRVDKRHCSDGEQETDVLIHSKKDRRGSLSESDLVKDLESFKHRKVSDVLKEDKWKPIELTDEEKKHLEQANFREKKMRENVLRVIQRNYKNMSVEDFEDAIYVAMMDYFCHYNPSSALQRKVVMLEKLVSKLQENYNRTFKQFCEAKYLLRRMVEIRKEDAKKCVCKDKLPFKLIRSVAVQVQTSRCRGGDLCPGTGIGLDPKFKASSSSLSSSKNSNISKKSTQEQNQSNSSNDDVPPAGGRSKDSASGSSRSDISNGSDPHPPPTSERARHISVSVPPPPVPVPRWTPVPKPTTVTNKSPGVRTRPQSELQNKKASPPPTSQPSTQTSQRTLRSSPSSSPSASPSLPPPPPKPSPQPTTNQSVVIDLTDKDDDQVASGRNTNARVVVQSPSKPAAQSTTPQTSPTTRLVKTSVLSPMPQLPPLPAAPLYKSAIKRPPQPVLKVCKADQSGIMLSWTLRTNAPLVNEISLYQVFACQENAGVTREWSTVGDVKALPLPMACTLSQFREGHRYHFVVRAVDKFKVFGEFSHPASILLVSKNGAANHAITACSTNNARH